MLQRARPHACVCVFSFLCARAFPGLKQIPIVSYILFYYFRQRGLRLFKFHFSSRWRKSWKAVNLSIIKQFSPLRNLHHQPPRSDKVRWNQTDGFITRRRFRGEEAIRPTNKQKKKHKKVLAILSSGIARVVLRICKTTAEINSIAQWRWRRPTCDKKT